MTLSFHLNGERVDIPDVNATTTLLDWLRTERGLTGTKEGCNEGDCGACTVMVTGEDGPRALNACILFLPQLQGRAVTTVEGLKLGDALHPVQQAMVDKHGSQCGFCTPGITMSLATAHLAGSDAHDLTLAGNLCRCTGYAPIIRAAEEAFTHPAPAHLPKTFVMPDEAEGSGPFQPRSADALAAWYVDHPEATLIAGATDLGLHVTKGMRDLGEVAFLNRCADLKGVEIGEGEIRVGAMTSLTDFLAAIAPLHPGLAGMLRRFGSVQVRNAATVGGNIANGSPIGDSPPALIALGAVLHLRRGDMRRSMPLEDFFVAYGKQDRQPGEFVEAVSFPRQADRIAAYKLSKRLDQDISAVCGCFNIVVEGGRVASARIAFGGMAATPKRARAVEAAITGQLWDESILGLAQDAWAQDFQPLSDMRASAAYRLEGARGMFARYLLADMGEVTDIAEVSA
jgi:xanthine dehydrogenase small subunit